MPSKKNKSRSNNTFMNFLVKLGFVLLFIGIIVLISFWAFCSLFNRDNNFKLKYVKLNMPQELLPKFAKYNYFIGEPIFDVDLREMAPYSPAKFPYLEYIVAKRVLPNCIEVEAKPRLPIARASRDLLVDRKRVVFPNVFEKGYNYLPLINGLTYSESNLGKVNNSEELVLAIKLLNKISANGAIKAYDIESIYVGNINDASFTIKDGPEIRIGDRDLEKRLFILAKIISDVKNEFSQIKYIDLKFKDPVMGYK